MLTIHHDTLVEFGSVPPLHGKKKRRGSRAKTASKSSVSSQV
ncbi:hypothetical protein RSAG8_04140, partial [Rhizoctonia solani AG-8 WAC10335]